MNTEIEILMRLVAGEIVTKEEVLRVLHKSSNCEKSEARRLDRHARRKIRDQLILEAATVLGVDVKDPWKSAERLEIAVERFETRVWPRLKAGISTGQLSPVDSALYRAFLTGERIVSTQRKIYDFLLTQTS